MVLIYRLDNLGHRLYFTGADGEAVEFDTLAQATRKAKHMGRDWFAVDLDNQMAVMTGLY